MLNQSWIEKVSNAAQLGGIETSVLDNGLGRGTRIAWINTGTGLRYKVVLDRAMDIAEAFYNQYSLAWLSHSGVTAAQPFSDKGINWLRTFGGGLLTTCGLSHAGGPESDEYGDRGLHGNISNTPAEIESIMQPDISIGKMEMSVTGRMRETQALGPSLELKRTISGKLGEAKIYIKDEVTNKGNAAAPHMLLYHCNFGWPLVDEGTDILWDGKWKPRDGDIETNRIFGKSNNFRKCPGPIDEHSGRGEEAAFIDINTNEEGKCNCGLYNSQLGIAVIIRFYKKQLPWLINWQHWGKHEYVTGLEPATNPPIGQAKARKQHELILLEPGETKTYDLEFEITTDKEIIKQFVKNTTIAV